MTEQQIREKLKGTPIRIPDHAFSPVTKIVIDDIVDQVVKRLADPPEREKTPGERIAAALRNHVSTQLQGDFARSVDEAIRIERADIKQACAEWLENNGWHGAVKHLREADL